MKEHRFNPDEQEEEESTTSQPSTEDETDLPGQGPKDKDPDE